MSKKVSSNMLPSVATAAIIALGAATLGTLPARAQQPSEEAVTVISLTDESGNATDIADEGKQQFSDTAAEVGGSNQLFSVQSSQSSDEVTILTQPVETEEFLVSGVTWDASEELDEGAIILMRVLEGKEWSEWTKLEPDSAESEERGGTEPYVTGGATGVQVQVNGDNLPAGMEVSLIPDTPSDDRDELESLDDVEVAEVLPTTGEVKEDTAPLIEDKQAPVSSSTTSFPSSQGYQVLPALANRAPKVISRAGWGAKASLLDWTPVYYDLKAAVVHHTAGSNNYTKSQAAGVVRGIYHYHSVGRGWGDIGYNFLVDKWGRIYEGRSGSLASPAGKQPQGAHAKGYNSHTLGISVMGDYTKVKAPQAAMDAMADVIAWKFASAGISNAKERSGFISPGSAYRPKGQNLLRIFVHRDVAATTCPGNDINSRIPALRDAVNTRLKNMTINKPAKTSPYTFQLNTGFNGNPDYIFKFGNKGEDVFSGDWNGNGTDTVATRKGSQFKTMNAHVTSVYPDKVFHYGRPGDTILVGDWNGDGVDTFAVRRGKTYHIKNSVTSGDADKVIHYGRKDDEVLVGDWNGDGRDTIAVRRGKTYHIKNRIAGGDADVVVHYGQENDEVVAGDWNGNGKDTLGVRRGKEFHLRNSLTGGKAQIYFNYGKPGDNLLVGDWNGRGKDTMGIWR